MDKEKLKKERLLIAPGVLGRFQDDGKMILRNPNIVDNVSFAKDILLLLYDFFLADGKGMKVSDFLKNWPQEHHNDLLTYVKILVDADILVNKDYKKKFKTSSNVVSSKHINLMNHLYLLKDSVRLSAYRRAIENKVSSDSIAMDLGAGTGVLSFFAAKAGAKKVYAIEKREDMIQLSKALAEENGVIDKITYISGESTKLTPDSIEEKVDVFISEIIGDGIFDENILEYTFDARERFCKPEAILIPSHINVHVFGYDTKRIMSPKSEIAKLERLYNLKLNKFKYLFENNLSIRYENYNTSSCELMTDQVVAKSIDLKTFSTYIFQDNIDLKVEKDGQIDAFCVYFSVKLDETTSLTNSPWAPSTHWRQMSFTLSTPLKVKKGQVIPLISMYDGTYKLELGLD